MRTRWGYGKKKKGCRYIGTGGRSLSEARVQVTKRTRKEERKQGPTPTKKKKERKKNNNGGGVGGKRGPDFFFGEVTS